MKMKKDDLIAALEAKYPDVVAADDRNLAEHRARNKALAKNRRIALREMAKTLTDDQLAELSGRQIEGRLGDRSSCPIALAPQLRRQITNLHRDYRKVITVADNRWDEHGKWLVFGDPTNETVC